MNIPNILTLVRFVLVPVFGYFLYREQYLFAILLFTFGAATDILDGYIARKFDMITSWGKLADPIADKLMQLTALGVLTFQGLIPAVVPVIVLAKESFMGIGSLMIYKKVNFVVSANWYGKLATVIFYFAIVMTIAIKMMKLDHSAVDMLVNIFIGIAVLTTLFAFFMYSLTFRQITRDLSK